MAKVQQSQPHNTPMPSNVIRVFSDYTCNAKDCKREQVAPGRWHCMECGQHIRILYQVTGIEPDARPSMTSRFPACPLQPLKD